MKNNRPQQTTSKFTKEFNQTNSVRKMGEISLAQKKFQNNIFSTLVMIDNQETFDSIDPTSHFHSQ